MTAGKGPYLNLEKAAAYCGYAPRTFQDKVRDYSIPRRGDKGNKFSVFDLDLFMEDPKYFTKTKRNLPVRQPGGFTPVRV